MKLNPRQKTGLMVIGISAVFILGILSISKGEEQSSEQAGGNVYHDIPKGDSKDIGPSKSNTYIQERGKKSSTEDYWDQCARKEEERRQQQEQSGSGRTLTSEELFGSGASSSSSNPVQKSYENPYRETPQEREERHRRRQEEAIQMAERMQGKQQADTAARKEMPQSEPEQAKEQPRVEVRRTSVISSLEEGNIIGSLGSDDTVCSDDGTKPFPCMFSKASKVKNGDRVSVILLEDIVVAGTLIPRNTHLMASCKVSSRLEMEIAIDGSKGIYCPDVGNEGQTVRNRGTSLIGSTLTSRMGRVAGDVVSTGVSLLQGRNGEIAISVPAGYTFYVMKKKEQ